MPYGRGGSRCLRLLVGNQDDVNVVDVLRIDAVAIYVDNHALVVCERRRELRLPDMFFVSGTKSNLDVRRICSVPAECSSLVIDD